MKAGKAYFETYGPGGDRSYADSWRDFTFDPKDVITLYKTLFGAAPGTLLDLGAADGALVRAFLARGVDALGVENSRYIYHKIKSAALRRRILLADVRDAARHLPPAGFDIIIDCTSQYLSLRDLRPYLRRLRRATRRLFCLLVEFQTTQPGPHQAVTLFRPRAWWKSQLFAAGFKHVPGGDGFFYK